ncbi:FAD-binding protein [Actinophytocola algeriensis]|uniref:FAD/FMN-containing dehydrogenase n=1 Tax=Actinophytocola algeriensis TaxID=1768010 RepID=A0A7W7VDP5_9PSEU|nr:FAD-binding protein [Actinophytocola algeriensis]MBB4906372.1 FAD/FMN-containing dehydrogenase [Actinophytocola algeriensis]MBE1477853.1 FAD/FMN-containing dehydrogenase [Actinophytocola algeriensis]
MRKLQISRRAVLAGATATAAATVVAFDPAGLGWLTAADADTEDAIRVPGLDGELVVDEESRTEAADDYGHIVHRKPIAVLRPGSVRDIATVIRFANQHGLKVAARGQGHSTFGQAQAGGGIVIDSRTLATIHRIGTGQAVVDAGVQWLDLIKATLAAGQTPPVATDYLGLSIGGTLSLGGIGGATSHHGMLVDNVLALEVVTGTGDIVRCSPAIRPDLFHAVLGGLGQFAVIARATVRLIPAATTARVYHLFYPDLASMTAAQRTALADRRFSYLEGQLTPTETGWSYMLEGVMYYTPPAEPDDEALTADLAPASTEITDMPYFDWLNRIYDLVQQLMALRLPGPWINVFIPSEATDEYVTEVLAETTPADAGGVVLLYPVARDLIRQPFVRLPDSPVVFLLALLRAVSPPNDAETQRLIAVNRSQYDRVVAVGGTHYPVGAIPMTEADWHTHYGDEWPAFRTAKRRHDPNNVLTPGQAIFR